LDSDFPGDLFLAGDLPSGFFFRRVNKSTVENVSSWFPTPFSHPPLLFPSVFNCLFSFFLEASLFQSKGLVLPHDGAVATPFFSARHLAHFCDWISFPPIAFYLRKGRLSLFQADACSHFEALGTAVCDVLLSCFFFPCAKPTPPFPLSPLFFPCLYDGRILVQFVTFCFFCPMISSFFSNCPSSPFSCLPRQPPLTFPLFSPVRFFACPIFFLWKAPSAALLCECFLPLIF